MYVCAPPVSGALRNWKRLSDSLELELWMVVKHVGAGNWTPVLWLVNKCS